jgi:hypothetical protein
LNVIENNNAGDVMPVAGALMHDERPANHAGVQGSGWLMLFLQYH